MIWLCICIGCFGEISFDKFCIILFFFSLNVSRYRNLYKQKREVYSIDVYFGSTVEILKTKHAFVLKERKHSQKTKHCILFLGTLT